MQGVQMDTDSGSTKLYIQNKGTETVPLGCTNFQNLHDTVSCCVFTMEPLVCVKTKHLGVFRVRVYL